MRVFKLCFVLIASFVSAVLYAQDITDFSISTEPTPSTVIQKEPRLFPLQDGSFLIAWEDYRFGETATFAQKFDSSGNRRGKNFPVVGKAGMAFLPDGRGMILGTETIMGNDMTDGAVFMVKGQPVTSSGIPQKETIIDNCTFPPYGDWGLGANIAASSKDFLYALNLGGVVSLKRINAKGETTFNVGNNINLPQTASSFSIAINNRDQYVLLWFNADPETIPKGIYATFFSPQDSVYSENVLIQAYKPRLFQPPNEEKQRLRAIAIDDTAFAFFWADADSLFLKYAHYSAFGQALSSVMKSVFPAYGYFHIIRNFSFTNRRYDMFGLLATFIHIIDVPTMPDIEVSSSRFYRFFNNGISLGNPQSDSLDFPSIGENVVLLSPDILACPVEIDNDVFLCRLRNFRWLDSLRINDDIYGANQILPKVVRKDSDNFFITWKDEGGIKGRQVDLSGNPVGNDVALDGREIHFFLSDKAVNLWKSLDYTEESEESGWMTIYDTRTWKPILHSQLTRTTFNVQIRCLPINDSSFVVLKQENGLSLVIYSINGPKIKQVMLESASYWINRIDLIPNNSVSFWVIMDGKAQLFSNELKPTSSVLALRLSEPILYIGQGRFLSLITSLKPEGNLASIIDTTSRELRQFVLTNDFHAKNFSLSLLDSSKFIATWTSNREVYARTFSFQGDPITDNIKIHVDVNGYRDWASACVLDNKVLFVWSDTRNFESGYDIYGSIHELAKITPVETKFVYSPNSIHLAQNYPNPFNMITQIRFNLSIPGAATLEIFNLKGQKVRTLVNGKIFSGEHQLSWNGRDDFGRELVSGVYFYRLRTGNIVAAKRMVLLR